MFHNNQLMRNDIIILSADISAGVLADEYLASMTGCFWQLFP